MLLFTSHLLVRFQLKAIRTLDEEKLRSYIHFGINRLSIGLQAWQNRILKQLGRIHKREQFLQNYELARKAGFDNVNIDLMFGLLGKDSTIGKKHCLRLSNCIRNTFRIWAEY